jgi:hypothetical protein
MDRKQRQLDRMIEEVSRGRRTLTTIGDPRVREAVRIALRLHADRPAELDDYARMRMRARILSGLEPRTASFADRVAMGFELLARPAPYIVRIVATAVIAASICMGATVASVETNSNDLFYPLKLASEDGRLALAGAPGDRAAVELSIAEHRLAEAERSAADGRTSDALVASAGYTQHIALAAAELGPEADSATLGTQLETTFNAQRGRAQALAAALAVDARTAQSSQVLAMLGAPSIAIGRTRAERVAETAAGLAIDLAHVAVGSAPRSAAAARAVHNAALAARAAADKLQNALNGRTKPTVGRAP